MNDNHDDTTISRMGKFFLSCLVLALFSGCSWTSLQNSSEPPPISSNKPIVYIHPASADLSRASIVVPPFRIPSDLESVRGEEVAALFQQTLLRNQVFHKVKLIPSPYGTVREAIEFGRKENVDLILTGTINHVLAGSSAGGGRLSLSLRIIDLGSTDTVWYMEQTVDQAMNYPNNSLPYRLSRIFSPPPVPEDHPTPSIPSMLTRISTDMSRIIKSGRYQPSMDNL